MELSDIKGLGEKRLKILNGADIRTPQDLVFYFPQKYLDLRSEPDLKKLEDGDFTAFIGVLREKPRNVFVRKGLRFIKAKFMTRGGQLFSAAWFNQPYILKTLITDTEFIVYGKIKRFKSSVEITAPAAVKFTGQSEIMPVYKNIKGVPPAILTESIKKTLENVKISGYFGEDILSRFGVMPLGRAVFSIHFPGSLQEAGYALESASLERLSYTMCAFKILKNLNTASRTFSYSLTAAVDVYKAFERFLPFSLTKAQKKAADEIFSSLTLPSRMNRLLQGDVGCGKTAVAFMAMYFAFLNGYQSALMAPTDILARQHYLNAVEIFDKFETKRPVIEFLSGSQTKLQRDTSLFNIKNGVADMVIGTHSVISDAVVFSSLSLAVIDEQQRFGVSQRAALENKSPGSDTLVMSATPIPRTLALTFYGDLEQSVIDAAPEKKAAVKTAFVPEEKIDGMLEYIKQDAQKGFGTFIVCPRIGEDEDDETLTSAQELYSRLKDKFKDTGIALIHSKIAEKERTEIMCGFKDGRIGVLIATTVVEVGVDIKNAVNMVIFNAERYGLSQLHQLRGRVGRGERTSYCFILSPSQNDETQKRLEYFAGCSDGFKLAEYDFYLRGAGDFLGTRQHGDGESFGAKITPEILEKARQIALFAQGVPSVVKEISENLESGAEYIKSLTLN